MEECLGHITSNGTFHSDLPLSSCAGGGYNSILKTLLPAEWLRSNAELRVRLGNELLCQAAKEGHLELIDLLFATEFSLVGLADSDDATRSERLSILFLATETGRLSSVQRLIEKCPTIAVVSSAGADTLHGASTNNLLNIAMVLVDHGAMTSVKGPDGDTPLHVAARVGCLEIVQLLVRANKKALLKSSAPRESTTPARHQDSDGIAKELEPGLFDAMVLMIVDTLDVENDRDSITLEVAIRSGHEEIVSIQLQNTPRETVIAR